MNLDELETSAKSILQSALDELGAINRQKELIEKTRHFHRSALRDSKRDLDSARGRLPDVLARLWLARCEDDAKAERLAQADIAALRKVIDEAVAMEQQAGQVVQGLDALEKRLQQAAVGEIGKGPLARRDTASNIINRIRLARDEGTFKHGDVLRFQAEKLGLAFSYVAPASPALAA